MHIPDDAGPLPTRPSSEAPSPQALSLLHEVAALLSQWLHSQEGGCVDIRRLPLSRADREAMGAMLGSGEVEAKVEAFGTTHIRETGISGVWWITHLNAAAEIIGEFIEVTRAPELVVSQRSDMMRGLDTLKARLEMAGED